MPTIGLPSDIGLKVQAMFEMAILCKDKRPSWSFDYRDFNSQHSLDDQAAIWKILSYVFQKKCNGP